MNVFRKVCACLCAAAMVLSIAGCGGNGSTPTTPESKPASSQADTSVSQEPQAELTTATLPLTEDPVTLSYWVGFGGWDSATMNSNAEKACYIELEKRTNVKIEWFHPPAGEGAEKFNLLFTSGDLPDIIDTGYVESLYRGGLDGGIKDGFFLRLNELIDEYAPNYNHIRTQNEELRKTTITNEGNIGAFYCLQPDEAPPWFGMIMRQDYLDKVNMEEPDTIDEWHDVLTAFKNELGIESPLFLEMSDITWPGVFIGAWDIGGEFYQDNGTVKYGPLDPKYKECMTVLNQWYEEGLIDREFMTRDYDTRNQMMLDGKIGALNNNNWELFHKGIQLAGKGELTSVPYPGLTEGQQVHIRQWDGYWKGAPAVITTSCENPEIAVKWFDYLYTEDGMMLMNYGIEGESYELVDGELPWDPIWSEFAPKLWNSGKVPEFTDKINNDPDGNDFYVACMRYRTHISPKLLYFRSYEPEPGCFGEGRTVDWCKADASLVIPYYSYTAEEQEEYSNIMGDINTFFSENFVAFITGKRSMDEWDNFVDALYGMGIEEAIQINQTAFDRYNNR